MSSISTVRLPSFEYVCKSTCPFYPSNYIPAFFIESTHLQDPFVDGVVVWFFYSCVPLLLLFCFGVNHVVYKLLYRHQ